MNDEIAGIPIHKGDFKDNVKKYQSFLDNLPEKTQKKIEKYFIIGISLLALFIMFCCGFLVGFERQCSMVEKETQTLCNEYICEHYDQGVCVNNGSPYNSGTEELFHKTTLLNQT